MSYDNKRMKMFKWLEDLSFGRAVYSKGAIGLDGIHVFSGNIYASNGIILAQVNYPEFEHLSDDVWSTIEGYTDSRGYLLQTPIIIEKAKQPKNNRWLSDMFIDHIYPEEFLFDSRVMRDSLKPFDIYGIKPLLAIGNGKAELTGHTQEVSIRILMMGVRR